MSNKDTSFHHDCGKGSRPRPYEVSQEEFVKKFDAIDWSVKSTTSVKAGKKQPETCIKCPRDVDMRCNYCGLRQADGTVKNLVVATSSGS